MKNAGWLLWDAQLAAGTGLCVGLDPHLESVGMIDGGFYMLYGDVNPNEILDDLRSGVFPSIMAGRATKAYDAVRFLAGVGAYFLDVIDVAWSEGVRVFKPQIAFFERFDAAGLVILQTLVDHIHELGARDNAPHFIVLDAKRGDIDSTQAPYYATYFSSDTEEVFPGAMGAYDVDAMTVTTWMGEDVLTPGLPWFKRGKGAIVVTRSSNPSGTTLQDLHVEEGSTTALSEKQMPFRITEERQWEIQDLAGGGRLTAHEVMLAETARFSALHELDAQGVSPIFSVMGSTVEMNSRFRRLRPGGIALVPGFGAQGGSFKNAMPLLVREGPLAGHLGILASSREHNYPWMKKYGGDNDPRTLGSDLKRAIAVFRQAERRAYEEAGAPWPF